MEIRQSYQKQPSKSDYFQASGSGPLVEKSDIPYCGEQISDIDIISNSVSIANSSTLQSINKVIFKYKKIKNFFKFKIIFLNLKLFFYLL